MQTTATDEQRRAIQEAARWFAKLQTQHTDDTVHADWTAWLGRHVENQKAWEKVQAVQRQFASVPSHLALPVLQKPAVSRRQLVLGAAFAAGLLPLGTTLYRTIERARWSAEYRTDIGEIAPLALTDGGIAVLDTYSAADVQYSSEQRQVVLHSGRLYVQTRPDTQRHPRPFTVRTEHGLIQALGTEFIVRVTASQTKVVVNQHAVRITPHDNPSDSMILHAGHRVTFDHRHFLRNETENHESGVTENFGAWRKGALIATNMPLARFVDRFQAYQRGYLFLDDSLSNLQVSGVFPLTNPPLALAALENTYPVTIRQLTRYLTWIEPRV